MYICSVARFDYFHHFQQWLKCVYASQAGVPNSDPDPGGAQRGGGQCWSRRLHSILQERSHLAILRRRGEFVFPSIFVCVWNSARMQFMYVCAYVCVCVGYLLFWEKLTKIAMFMCKYNNNNRNVCDCVCMCVDSVELYSVGPASLKYLIRLMSVINPGDLVLLFSPPPLIPPFFSFFYLGEVTSLKLVWWGSLSAAAAAVCVFVCVCIIVSFLSHCQALCIAACHVAWALTHVCVCVHQPVMLHVHWSIVCH